MVFENLSHISISFHKNFVENVINLAIPGQKVISFFKSGVEMIIEICKHGDGKIGNKRV